MKMLQELRNFDGFLVFKTVKFSKNKRIERD